MLLKCKERLILLKLAIKNEEESNRINKFKWFRLLEIIIIAKKIHLFIPSIAKLDYYLVVHGRCL